MPKTKLLRIFLILFSFIKSAQANSQATPGFGSWTIINLKYPFSKSWYAYVDAQVRSSKFYNDYYSYDYKAAINYAANNKFGFLVGIAEIKNYQTNGNFKKPLLNTEFRTWEQSTMYNSIKAFKFESRLRVEQRFTNHGYFNRFRYRLNISAPLNKKTFENNALYFNTSDELFFVNTHPLFSANQFFIGAGFIFSQHISILSGWINQLNEIPGTNITFKKNYLQTSFLFTLNKQQHHGGMQD